MEKLTNVGRKFYGVCLMGLGFQQITHANFLPIVLPAWPDWIPGGALWAYLIGAILIVVGVAIFFEKHARTIALVSGGIFLALFTLCHVPHLVFINPYSNYLGTWTQAFKLFALSGGAFVVAGSYSETQINSGNAISILLERLIPLGSVFFSITMIIFGIDHFLYVEFVEALVPAWIPWHNFWTYFAAVALIGAGVAIILKFKLKLVGILLGTMLFLWFLILHIPRSIADPVTNMGNEVTSSFQALGFSGIAFVLAFGVKTSVRSGEK
jgi:uncharacterized membrane protein YphA (DoxX/SURF4 family)